LRALVLPGDDIPQADAQEEETRQHEPAAEHGVERRHEPGIFTATRGAVKPAPC
jgi:hypothetical protein